MWALAALLGLLYLVTNLVFDRPVRACVDVLVEKPLSTGLGGLLVVLLAGPVFLILAVSVIGLVVIPFVACALLFAGLVGRVATARWIGGRLVAEDEPGSRWQGTRSLLIGMALLAVAYLVPVLGFVAWTTLGVFGLGAVAAVVIAGLQRENPPQAAPAAPVAGPPAAPEGPAPPAPGAEPAPAPAEAAAEPALPPPPAAPPDLSVYPRAGFGSRLGALALDFLLLGISSALLNIEDGWLFLLIIVYHVGFWAWKGHHDRRHRRPRARRAARRRAGWFHGGAGARTVRDLLGGRGGAGLVLDALGPRAADVARQDSRHHRRARAGRRDAAVIRTRRSG